MENRKGMKKISLDTWIKGSKEDRMRWLVEGYSIGRGAEIFSWAQSFKSVGVHITDDHMLRLYNRKDSETDYKNE